MIAKEEKKRQVINISRIIMIIFTLSVLLFPEVRADDNSLQISMAQQVQSGVFGTLNESIASPVYGVVTAETFTTGVIAGFYNSIKVLGAMWVIILALSRMLTNIEREEDKMQCIFKAMLEIGIAGLLIMYLGEIMNGIMLIGSEIVKNMSGLLPTGNTTSVAGAKQLLKTMTGKDHGSFAWEIYAFAMLAFPWICSLLLSVAAKFMMYQLYFEIGMRRAFAPIAVADIYQEGLRSPGARYFKRFFAVYIKIAMCYLAAFLCQSLSGAAGSYTDTGGAINYIFEIIAINFTCIGVMMKAGEMANDVVGA